MTMVIGLNKHRVQGVLSCSHNMKAERAVIQKLDTLN